MFLATRRVAGRPAGSPIPGQLPPNPIFLPPSLVLFSYPMLQGRTGSLGWLLLAVPSLSVLPRESPTSCAPGAEGTILELLGPALAAPTLNCKAADAAIQGPPGLETEAGWGQELSGAREATISKGVPPLLSRVCLAHCSTCPTGGPGMGLWELRPRRVITWAHLQLLPEPVANTVSGKCSPGHEQKGSAHRAGAICVACAHRGAPGSCPSCHASVPASC